MLNFPLSVDRNIMRFYYSEPLSAGSSFQSSLDIQCNIHYKVKRGISFEQKALVDYRAIGSFVD